MGQNIGATSVSFVFPPKEAGLTCPYLPPIPIPVKSTILGKPDEIQLYLTPCLGDRCAIFESCQGSASAPAHQDRDRSRWSMLASITRAIQGFPFLGVETKQMLSDAITKLDAMAAPPPVAPSPAASSAPGTA